MVTKTLYLSAAHSAAAIGAAKTAHGSKLPSLPARPDLAVLCSSMQELRDWYDGRAIRRQEIGVVFPLVQ